MNRHSKTRRYLAMVLGFCGLVYAGATQAGELTAQQMRGQQIYLSGKSPREDKILALLGNGQTRMPAALFPCAKCHGENGAGTSEGGVVSANITWHALTKPYQLLRSDRRTRPPYDRDSKVVRAFSLGLDSGGARLNQIMPRYQMTRKDADDLVAYLKVLGTAATPGVSDSEITLAIISEQESWVPLLLRGYFDMVNAAGGIFGRSIALEVYTRPQAPEAIELSLAQFIREIQPLAVVAPYLAGADQEIWSVLQSSDIPVSAVRPPRLHEADRPGRSQFFALPDPATEARVLSEFAIGFRGKPMAILQGPGAHWRDIADESMAAFAAQGMQAPLRMEQSLEQSAATQIGEMLSRGIDTLLLLTSPTLGGPVVQALADSGNAVVVLAPGSAKDAFSQANLSDDSQLFLSRSTSVSDVSSDALNSLRVLAPDIPGLVPYSSDVLGVLAAASILVEGLRQGGRAVTQRGLINAIEQLYRHQTGFVRPVTFGPDKHQGTNGAHLVEYDTKTGRALGSYWVELD